MRGDWRTTSSVQPSLLWGRVSLTFSAAYTRLASGDCSFHFTSVHSSAGFINEATSPGFPWVLVVQNPALVFVQHALGAPHHLPGLIVSLTKLPISFLFSFFSLIFSSLSFILPFFLDAGNEPPNLLPLFYLLALTPLNTLPSSASLTCLYPHWDNACFLVWSFMPFPSLLWKSPVWCGFQDGG